MNEKLIPFVARNDLESYELSRNGETCFVIADRLRNKHTELSEIEFFILEFLAEARTLSQLTDELFKFYGARFTDQQLLQYLQRLMTLNLVFRPGFGAGEALLLQKQNEDRGRLKSSVLGWLSIKLPGFYPQSLLRTLAPIGSLFFNRISLGFLTVCFGLTFVFVLLRLPGIFARIPATSELLAADHIFLVIVAYLLVKIFHELGHGLACRRVGHECSEMGIIFLVFMPCLYCEVSDVWTQTDKWKRIFVSAAGVIVEIAIAIICFWGWWLLDDGKMATLLFSVMLITSLNTLLVNGNPLMRFDGYYVLSDYWEIPNLSSRSSAVLREFLIGLVCYRDEPIESEKPGRQLAYALASACYRWFIMISIAVAIWFFFAGMGLKAFGSVALVLLAATTLLPIWQGITLMPQSSIRKLNLPGLAFLAILLSVFVFVFLSAIQLPGLGSGRISSGGTPTDLRHQRRISFIPEIS